MSEIIVATRTPWFHRSAFKAWVKDSLTTLGSAMIVDVAGWVSWRQSLVVAAVLIGKGLLHSLYEIIYGKDADSFREVPRPTPTAPPDPQA